MSNRIRKIIGWIPTYAVWIISSLITIIPIYWMIIVSARSRVELFDKPDLIIKSFYAPNYTDVITNETFRGYMLNSVIVSTSNAILVAFLALLATYSLSRYKLAASDNIFFWTITNRMAPPRLSCCHCSSCLPSNLGQSGSSTHE